MRSLLFVIIVCGIGGERLSIQHHLQMINKANYKQETDLTIAFTDIILALPATHVSLLFDHKLDKQFSVVMAKTLHESGVTTSIHYIDNSKNREQVGNLKIVVSMRQRRLNYKVWFCQYTMEAVKKYKYSANIIFSSSNTAKSLLCMIQAQDLIHRKLLHVLYWGKQAVDVGFAHEFSEAMRIAVVSNPRPGIYRVYYSQADPSGDNSLKLVNWWSREKGLFRNPVLPSSRNVYKNFHGRTFHIPVLHKPPWNFVIYYNDGSIYVDGGRDDKLLKVISSKLNFRYEYFDPPEKNQGSSFTKNGSFPGVLGLVWKREADFFMGDVTINLERSIAVEFSFLTLVDSEIFVTHRPSKLNEALALVRPFQWQVWPLVITLIILSGPALFLIMEAPLMWQSRARYSKGRGRHFSDCVWFSIAAFLRQGGKQPDQSHKIRLVMILMTLGSTYVIGDMYSANLTSLLARPGREKPITTLEQLEEAMETRSYQLFVEKHSSSFSMLENSTGVYERLWAKMQNQRRFIIESVEAGMKMVREQTNVAVLGGRETVYFDTKRFGSYNFHLSEKLNTRYSAIAMQNGCPYVENFNKILMQLFESGILTKMTEEEYEILGEKLRAAAGFGQSDEEIVEAMKETRNSGEASDREGGAEAVQEGDSKQSTSEDLEHQLQPLNTRMLQGAFYMLLIGYSLSGFVLVLELNRSRCRDKILQRKAPKVCRDPLVNCTRIKGSLKKVYEKFTQRMEESLRYIQSSPSTASTQTRRDIIINKQTTLPEPRFPFIN